MKHLLDCIQYWECTKTIGDYIIKGEIYWVICHRDLSKYRSEFLSLLNEYYIIDNDDKEWIVITEGELKDAFSALGNWDTLDEHFTRIL